LCQGGFTGDEERGRFWEIETEAHMLNKIGFIILVVLFGLILATDQSYEEAEKEAEHYRDMVCQGFWPDYEELKPECD
jgi:hypothetical protein